MSQANPFVRVGVVFIALCCAAAVLADPPATETQMLLYCDQSGGAMLHLPVWQRLAVLEGSGHTTVTDANTFANHLDNSTWQSVTVLACYTATEPAYVASLRAYMQAHPETHTTLLLWHTNGVTPPPHTYVAATTACVLWSRGMTGIGYAMDATPGGGPGGQASNPGNASVDYVWPDFADIVVGDWRPVRPSPVLDGAIPSPGGTGYDDCAEQCLNDYLAEIKHARKLFERDLAQCEALHAPSEVTPGDPAAYAQCLRDVHHAAVERALAAVNAYLRCLELCEREHAGMQGGS